MEATPDALAAMMVLHHALQVPTTAHILQLIDLIPAPEISTTACTGLCLRQAMGRSLEPEYPHRAILETMLGDKFRYVVYDEEGHDHVAVARSACLQYHEAMLRMLKRAVMDVPVSPFISMTSKGLFPLIATGRDDESLAWRLDFAEAYSLIGTADSILDRYSRAYGIPRPISTVHDWVPLAYDAIAGVQHALNRQRIAITGESIVDTLTMLDLIRNDKTVWTPVLTELERLERLCVVIDTVLKVMPRPAAGVVSVPRVLPPITGFWATWERLAFCLAMLYKYTYLTAVGTRVQYAWILVSRAQRLLFSEEDAMLAMVVACWRLRRQDRARSRLPAELWAMMHREFMQDSSSK